MEIKLNKDEGVLLAYSECPRCHKPFNTKKRKKTTHHVIPMFLQPKTEIEVNLCKICHEELNNCYRGQEIVAHTQNVRFKSENFTQFKGTVDSLRRDFYDKKINRGQFGEGLWSSLVSYLEIVDKTLKQLERKK